MNRSKTKSYNTSKKMRQALLDLLEKNEFDDITVSEVCKEAQVNRTTFYAHYDNTHDLLMETYNEFLSSFVNAVESNNNLLNELTAEETTVFATSKYLVPFLEFMKENRKTFQIYMNSIKFLDTGEITKFFEDTVFSPIILKFYPADPKTIHYMSAFFLRGVFAIVLEWIKQGCEDDVLYISEIIVGCVRSTERLNKN